MPRRRQLKGIAVNLAQYCMSRNFESDGYWAMGKFYAYAKKYGTDSIILNLTDYSIKPESKSNTFISAIQLLVDVVEKIINTNKIPASWVRQINIVLNFNAKYEKKYHYWGSALGGKPFFCKAIILTDLGRKYEYETTGIVWIHNPQKERQSFSF
ncbi:MAG: Unknown protein [uncultured Campylobacterales bacterium]|uniref:Uncharacterized protein n=1 Tax=uncultured Campylobacterales bacterium TaxID=352960 RepID=A0A6S6SQI7_9BACT|nr:MAG: Unknown protein [uncultured Campylobacterales bacterium]